MLPNWCERCWGARGENQMPFQPGGTDTGPTASSLRIDPAQVLHLKAELQPIHDELETFLNLKGRGMSMQPLGADPVSFDTADLFNVNTQSALDAAWGYIDELKNVLHALDQAAKTYNLVEDANTQAFRQALQ
jgi:PE family protein